MIDHLRPYSANTKVANGWLGPVPGHWELLPGRACYREKKVSNLGMAETTVLSLSYGRIVIKPVDKLRGLVPESFETYQIVDKGDIIIRPTDLQNDWNSLRVGLSKDRGIITSAYICLATTDRLSREFGYLLLNAYDLRKVFYGLGSGLRQNLDWRDFKYLPCLVPPAAEQEAIVRFVTYADRRIQWSIRTKQQLIKLLEEQKQVITHHAVTRGLDPNAPMKESEVAWLREVPEHWSRVRLKDVAVVQTGLTLGKDYANRATESRPYLRVANVQAGRLDLREVKRVDVPPNEADRTTLRFGDVLMTEGGDIDKLGRGCVWRDEIAACLHQNHLFAVRCREDVLLPEFLAGVMGSGHGRAYFQLTAKQTTNLASTNSTTLRAFPIFLPPTEEQKAILEEISRETTALDSAIDRAQTEIALLREYRVRLIADVVTGKYDVREAAARLPNDDDGAAAPYDEGESLAEDELAEELTETDEIAEGSLA